MKKALSVVVLALLVAVATAPAQAGNKSRKNVERTWTAEYMAPSSYTALAPSIGFCHAGYELGCVGTSPYWGEGFASATVKDATDLQVSAELYQFAGDEQIDSHLFCGSTKEPIPLEPETDFVGVALLTGPCNDLSPAVATTGTVTITFSNRR